MAESAVTSAAVRGLDEESQQMLVDIIRQARKRLLTKEKVLQLDKDDLFPEEILRTLTGPEYGLQLLFIPEIYNGMGGGARDTCVLVEEMSKICLGVATAFFAMQLGTEPIIGGATDEQRENWLGKIAEGRRLVAYAVTEPEAGSNLASLKTTANPVTDDKGDVVGYKINGSKQFISTGAYADFLTVLARTPEGPTFFVVEKGTEGFTASKGEEKHGIRASNTSALTFEDVFVPIENRVGDVCGKGLAQASRVFGYTRLMVAGMALGAGEAALEIAIPYAKERVQFGTPLSEKQGYTHKLIVPHAVRLLAAKAYIQEVALQIDPTDDDYQVEGAIAKLFASESANVAAEAAIQALGGYGYIREYEVEKIKRDVRITCIYEGTSEILQTIISTFRWKKTRKSKGGYYDAIATEMESIGADRLALATRATNELIQIADKNKMTKQQIIMFQLADMETHVEVGAALARKARQAGEAGDADAETLRLACSIFSAEVAARVAAGMMVVLHGTGTLDEATATETAKRLQHTKMASSGRDMVKTMDALADILFER